MNAHEIISKYNILSKFEEIVNKDVDLDLLPEMLSIIAKYSNKYKERINEIRNNEAWDVIHGLICIIQNFSQSNDEFRMYLPIYATSINYCFPNGFKCNNLSISAEKFLERFCEEYYDSGRERNTEWEKSWFPCADKVHESWIEYKK